MSKKTEAAAVAAELGGDDGGCGPAFTQVPTPDGPVWVNPQQVTDIRGSGAETSLHLTSGRCVTVTLSVDDTLACLV